MEDNNKKAPRQTEPSKPDKAIVPQGEAGLQAEALIAQAIEKGVPVETMERLLAMRRELKAEFAKEAFDSDLSNFQADCPVIKKDKKVYDKNGRLRYQYAPIEAIVKQVGPRLKKYGFSYTVDAEVEETWVTAICKVTHRLGHSETSRFRIPIDLESYMNAPQRFASALTFAKRYAFCNAFGILTGDEDNDATIAIEPVARQSAQNGISGPITPKPANGPSDPPRMVSKAQIGYIKGLQKAKGVVEASEEELAKLTSPQASELIEKLRRMP